MRSKSEAKMQEIIDYINRCYFNTGKVPSMQEIADVVGLNKSNVCRYLSEMEERGLISKGSSSYELKTNSMKKVTARLQQLPVVGDVACGTPILAEQNIESYFTMSGNILGSGDYFILRAKGDSMINVDIHDGDYVVIRQQDTAEDGQVVAALVNDGECTLKRFYRDTKTKTYRLHPENDNMEDMIFDKVNIQGVAVMILRNLKL